MSSTIWSLLYFLPHSFLALPHTLPASSSSPLRVLSDKSNLASTDNIYCAWITSRSIPNRKTDQLAPGAHRPLTRNNFRLAGEITTQCVPKLFDILWKLHPWRTALMILLDIVRGVFPAFRGYSQAMIINELQSLISSGEFPWPRISWLLVSELARMTFESLIDSFATSNEAIVHSSARFLMEYKQMEQRIRLDVPTLADPVIRDLLHESDIFVRSFNGMASFGFLSPFDFVRILTLVSELVSHIVIISSMAFSGTHIYLLIFSILSSTFPFMLSWWHRDNTYLTDLYTPEEARASARQEKMRNLAHSDTYRPEIILFGLGPWILRSWARARKTMLGLEQLPTAQTFSSPSIFTHIDISGMFSAFQNIPLLLILRSSTSLGSFTLYRSSVQALIFTSRNLVHTVRMAFQGIFLMGAFCAAMEVEPRLQPSPGHSEPYKSSPSGMKIEARNLNFTYPGSVEPVLKDVSFTLEAGETLAIVGYNGSGKSTLANILLRILDFDAGQLLVNGVDIRRYRPEEFHDHVTAVFQGFSKFNSSVKENVGIGYVQDLRNVPAIEEAVHLAGAGHIVYTLPKGLKTKLDAMGYDSSMLGKTGNCGPQYAQHGLSGGEWQRIAISRALMRAHQPEVELFVFDEPTSSLDAHAQNRVFDTIEKLCRPSGERMKSVIFITHRLSTARRADKVAMMDNGTITEFGTHQELLKRDGSYAALYRASV